jgi:AraC family transcriptional activator FtrA
MHGQLDQPHPTAKLAAVMNLSERTFLRRFKEATGTTPGEWLSEARVQRAKTLLESTDFNIEMVANKVGFGTAMTLRHHFRKRLHISPASYRKQFSTRTANI